MQSKRADVRIIESETLSDNWYILKKYTFDLQRRDGEWQRQNREVYDRGNGATILLYNRDKKTVILTRQFRFPVFINGHKDDLIEAAAGLLDNMDPESRIKAEAEEETGYSVSRVEKIFEAYMSRAPSLKNSIFISPNTSRKTEPVKAVDSKRRVRILTYWK